MKVERHFKLFVLCFVILMTSLLSVYAAELSDSTLKNDLNYYYNLVERERLDYNDRLYILNRIKAKYKDSDVDITFLEREIAKLKNMGQGNIAQATPEKK